MPEELTEVLSTRLPQELMEELEQMAASERRPVAMMTRMLLEEAISARAKKTSKKN